MMLTNWSYSRYGTWKKCPALLRYQMEDTTKREGHPAAVRGQNLHKSVELYLLGEAELPMELAYYKDFFDHLRDQGAVPEMPMALNKNWEPVDWDDPNRWWRGVLDCVIDLDTVANIYDWKTGNEYADHREQREIYAAAYHSLKPTPFVRVFHVYLDKKQNTTTLFHEDEIKDLRKDWELKIEEMFSDKAFAPNPGFYCRTCPYSRWNGGSCKF